MPIPEELMSIANQSFGGTFPEYERGEGSLTEEEIALIFEGGSRDDFYSSVVERKRSLADAQIRDHIEQSLKSAGCDIESFSEEDIHFVISKIEADSDIENITDLVEGTEDLFVSVTINDFMGAACFEDFLEAIAFSATRDFDNFSVDLTEGKDAIAFKVTVADLLDWRDKTSWADDVYSPYTFEAQTPELHMASQSEPFYSENWVQVKIGPWGGKMSRIPESRAIQHMYAYDPSPVVQA